MIRPSHRIIPTPDGDLWGDEVDLTEISGWQPTIPQLRPVIEAGLIVGQYLQPGTIPETARRYAPLQNEVDNTNDMCLGALRAGRVMDFGFIPNALIKEGGNRGGPLYEIGALAIPFLDPWLLYHRWEQGVALYLINPLEARLGGDLEVAELEPLKSKGEPRLSLGDRVLLQPDEAHPSKPNTYPAHVAPSIWRYLPAVTARDPERSIEGAATGNVLDPVMTCLLMLNTDGVRRETIRVPDKLNKARLKNRKPPIPPYERVHSEPYITALLMRGARGDGIPKGGHHASPIAHIRRGHIRTYADGKKTFIRDCLVNFTDEAREAFRGGRSHYEIKG
jgi:hypothetical protein